MGIKNYVYANSIEEVITLIRTPGNENRILSGGANITTQLRSGLFDCDTLIDISRVDTLQTIEIINIENHEFLKIGAALNFNQIIKHAEVQSKFPLLSKVLLDSSDPARRNGYTFGGRLASKNARGMIFPALVVLDAMIVTQDEEGEHIFFGADWFDKNFKPENVLITAILLPVPQKPLWVIKDAKRREAPGEQIAGVVVTADRMKDNEITKLRIAGISDIKGLVTFQGIESVLEGKQPTIALFDLISELIYNPQKINWRLSEEEQYRNQLVATLLKRCLRQVFLDDKEEQE
jgi:CO/xanthine dehydrogenase FAD-binding subunit